MSNSTELLKTIEERQVFRKYSHEELMTEKWMSILINEYNHAKEKEKIQGKESLTQEEKHLLDKYIIMNEPGKKTQVLVKHDPNLTRKSNLVVTYLVSFEDGMDYLKNAHIKTNHGDFDAMKQYLKSEIKYNHLISPFCYKLFYELQMCLDCKNQMILPLRKITSEANSVIDNRLHCRVLIDLQSLPRDNSFNHLLTVLYSDIDFVQLRPLTTDGPNEIFTEIYKIFMDLYVPKYVDIRPRPYSEFVVDAVNRLCTITHHDIEVRLDRRGHIAIRNIVHYKIMEWMKKEGVENWSIGCNFVQWELNNTVRKDGITPFEKMFNKKTIETVTNTITPKFTDDKCVQTDIPIDPLDEQ